MRCPRCQGTVLERKYYAVGSSFTELYCVNCGRRWEYTTSGLKSVTRLGKEPDRKKRKERRR